MAYYDSSIKGRGFQVLTSLSEAELLGLGPTHQARHQPHSLSTAVTPLPDESNTKNHVDTNSSFSLHKGGKKTLL